MFPISEKVKRAYSWLHRGTTVEQVLDIPAHLNLYHIAHKNGLLIDFLRPSGCHCSRPLSQISGLANTPMDIQIAQVQQELLKGFGLNLGDDFYNLHLNNLLVNYLLYSSLCYVQTEGQNGLDSYYVTKQVAIIEGLKPFINSKDIAKLNKGYFNDRYGTELSELTESKHKVIVLRPDADGYHLGKGIFYSNSRNNAIYPAYVLRGYKKALLGVLKRRVIRISCLDSLGGDIKFVTTLNGDALCKWLGVSEVNRCQPIWRQVEGSYCEANLTLPNLDVRNEFITINLLHIKNVQILP
ncbi:MAG: hypothetical protein ACLTBU_09890 [Zhenhengia sp.]|uniref:hypothetical protein n=1 Tax=Zhenhengia sp. TaxID=2944208 RepID=UPI0039923801